jgi:DNA polymerase-1
MTIVMIDGNSVGRAANAATRLSANGHETQAIFGTMNTVRDMSLKFRGRPLVLWDGLAQWRYDLYPEYKANRELDPNKQLKPYEIAAQKAKESYRKQRPHIIEALRLLGVRQVIPKHDEADDAAGYLSKQMSDEGKKIVLVSRDHDWLQLVNENVNWYNPVEKELVTKRTFEEYTSYKHPSQFVAEKCLIGDSSDCITGVAGVGDKCAPLLIHHYGTMKNFFKEVESAGADWVAPTPELRRYRKKLIEFGLNTNGGIDIYERNLKLMSLLNVQKPKSVEVIKSPFNNDEFVEFCHEFAFQSILRRYDDWIEPFKSKE